MKRANVIGSCLILLAMSAWGSLYYANILVDGIVTDTVPQWKDYYIEIVCDPGDTFGAGIYIDENNDCILTYSEDFCVVSGDTAFWDNAYEPTDPNPFRQDLDTTWGRILIRLPVGINNIGCLFFALYDEMDTTVLSLYQAPPESVTGSISGYVELEGIPRPDTIYECFHITALNTDNHRWFMFFLDSTGEYYVPWAFAPGWCNVSLSVTGDYSIYLFLIYDLGYDLRGDMDTSIYVDGHITDVNFFIPFWVPDSLRFYGDIVSTGGELLSIDSLILIERRWWIGSAEYGDTFYADVVDGDFSIKLPKSIDGMLNAGYRIRNELLPDNYMKNGNYDRYLRNIIFNPGDTSSYVAETLYFKNERCWIQYSSFTPGYDTIAVRLFENWLYSDYILDAGSICELNYYSGPLVRDYIIFPLNEGAYAVPDNFTLVKYSGEPVFTSANDTLFVHLREFDAFLVCSTLTTEGELLDFRGSGFSISYYDSWYLKSVYFDHGTVGTYLFGNKSYQFVLYFSGGNFMTEPRPIVRINPGYNIYNWIFYPMDTCFYLYVNLPRESFWDDTLGAIIRTNDYRIESPVQRFPTNRWVRIPMSGYFSSSCMLEINQKDDWLAPPFMRFIENNRNIPVQPGDSIYLTVILPIDTFILDLRYDSADTFTSSSPDLADFYMDYFYLSDTSLAFRISPSYSAGRPSVSMQLPIFEQRFLFNLTPKSYHFSRHYFIANHNQYVMIGGPYRPDRMSKYLNLGSGEMLLTLEGYPAEYLGADTVFYPSEWFTCVEVPDHPENRYFSELFLFKTRPDRHPYGDGSVIIFHDVCDGQWTIRLPDTLPGGFVPTVVETSFYCSDIAVYPDEWNEFPIRIPVIVPPGITGNIYRQNRFFAANAMCVDIIDEATGWAVMTKTPWQVHPWMEPSIFIKYFIKEGELAHGNYRAVLRYLTWPFTFVYPETISFSYYGGDLVLDDIYIGFKRSRANVVVIGLPDSLREGACIRLIPAPGTYPVSVYEPFYTIDARYPMPAPGETTIVPLPEMTWRIQPIVRCGLLPNPPETTIYIAPGSSPPPFDIVFDYGGFVETAAISGRIVRDTMDLYPISFDSVRVRLLSLYDESVVREVGLSPGGDFVIGGLIAPSSYRFRIFSFHRKPLFFSKNDFIVNVPVSDTLELGNIFADNANAKVRVRFYGLSESHLFSISHIRVLPVDNVWMTDTIYYPYNSGSTSDTFRLCDGRWKIFAPRIPEILIEPQFFDTIFADTTGYYVLSFVYPAKVDDNILPNKLDLKVYPNPFNSFVSIELELPQNSDISLYIYSITGERVASIAKGNFDAGVYRFIWDGKTDVGKQVSSGVYFYRIETPRMKKTVKGVLLK